jgi:hypothetical protein
MLSQPNTTAEAEVIRHSGEKFILVRVLAAEHAIDVDTATFTRFQALISSSITSQGRACVHSLPLYLRETFHFQSIPCAVTICAFVWRLAGALRRCRSLAVGWQRGAICFSHRIPADLPKTQIVTAQGIASNVKHRERCLRHGHYKPHSLLRRQGGRLHPGPASAPVRCELQIRLQWEFERVHCSLMLIIYVPRGPENLWHALFNESQR